MLRKRFLFDPELFSECRVRGVGVSVFCGLGFSGDLAEWARILVLSFFQVKLRLLKCAAKIDLCFGTC
jgi:hypothetical protein